MENLKIPKLMTQISSLEVSLGSSIKKVTNLHSHFQFFKVENL